MKNRKIYIQDKEDSHLGSSIYVIYDRFFRHKEQMLWLSTDFHTPIPEIKYFFNEKDATEWLAYIDGGSDWTSNASECYIVELPTAISTDVLLSNDHSKKLQELISINVIESLWHEQFAQ